MTESLLIRDVPRQIHDWLRDERGKSLRTQNEVVLDILDQAFRGSLQMPLFGEKRRIDVVHGALPFTFVDLFAGIGGLRIALERVGGRCRPKRYRARMNSTQAGEAPTASGRKSTTRKAV